MSERLQRLGDEKQYKLHTSEIDHTVTDIMFVLSDTSFQKPLVLHTSTVETNEPEQTLTIFPSESLDGGFLVQAVLDTGNPVTSMEIQLVDRRFGHGARPEELEWRGTEVILYKQYEIGDAMVSAPVLRFVRSELWDIQTRKERIGARNAAVYIPNYPTERGRTYPVIALMSKEGKETFFKALEQFEEAVKLVRRGLLISLQPHEDKVFQTNELLQATFDPVSFMYNFLIMQEHEDGEENR